MRTTVRLDDALLREAKVRAAEQGITLTQLLDESLRERLALSEGEQRAGPLDLPTYGKHGVRPGVDLADNRALADLMDESVPFPPGGSARRST